MNDEDEILMEDGSHTQTTSPIVGSYGEPEALTDSILGTIKQMLGIPASHEEFDAILVLDINTAFSILHQVGVGPSTPYSISGSSETWDEFIVQYNMEMAKQFVAMKVRELFDPPQGSAAAEAMTRNLDELIWRLSVGVHEEEFKMESE